MISRNFLYLLFLFNFLSGCATASHQVMEVTNANGRISIFPVSDYQAFETTIRELQATYGNIEFVPKLSGTKRGFRFSTTGGLDTENYFFEVIAVRGTSEGKEVSGFLVEGSSNGTRLGTSGAIKKTLAAIRSDFESIHPAILITGLRRIDFQRETSFSRIFMQVNTFGNHPKELPKVYVSSSKPNVASTDPEFMEYREVICEAIKANGLSCVNEFKEASAILFVNYGISSPIVEYNTWSKPIYSTDYIAPSQSKITFNNRFGQETGSATIQDSNKQFGGLEQRYAGQESGTTKTVSFRRLIEIESIKIGTQTKREPTFFWKTTIESTGSSNDLRSIFRYMILKAAPHLGISTGQALSFKVPMD